MTRMIRIVMKNLNDLERSDCRHYSVRHTINGIEAQCLSCQRYRRYYDVVDCSACRKAVSYNKMLDGGIICNRCNVVVETNPYRITRWEHR